MKVLNKCTPEAAGIRSSTLLKLINAFDKLEYLNSFMILRHGKIVASGSWTPYDRNVPHALYSLSKSFVSVAIGIAQSEGLLKLDDPVLKFFPECEAIITDERVRKITLRHLLTMTSGSNIESRLSGDDWVGQFFAAPLAFEPGTTFFYNSSNTYLLAAVIRGVTGSNVREYLGPRLFEPLGIVPGIWGKCPAGTNCGGWGLYLKTEAIARFGQLLLNGGSWGGQQLIPAAYLREAVRPIADNSANLSPDWKQGYGYAFWMSRHGYRGDGAAGQFAVVLPEEDMVIAITACLRNMQDVLDRIWEILLPELEDHPLLDDPMTNAELELKCHSLQIPPAKGAFTSEYLSQCWRFRPNFAGIEACTIELGSDSCALSFNFPRGMEQIRAGFGYYDRSIAQLTDLRAHPIAASAAWITPDVLEVRTFCTDTVFRDIYRIDFAAKTLERTSFGSFRNPFPRLRVL